MDWQSCPLIIGSCKSLGDAATLKDASNFLINFLINTFQLLTRRMRSCTNGRTRQKLSDTKGSCSSPSSTSCLLPSGDSTFQEEKAVSTYRLPWEEKCMASFSSNSFTLGGHFSVLQVVISLQRHTGYFLIQIYLPCTLLVVLSWVGFWLNREATSDRVTLCK